MVSPPTRKGGGGNGPATKKKITFCETLLFIFFNLFISVSRHLKTRKSEKVQRPLKLEGEGGKELMVIPLRIYP